MRAPRGGAAYCNLHCLVSGTDPLYHPPQDTHDLFATLIVSLQLSTHRQLFKTFHNSFTTDEAAENLSALKFSQSNRAPDPKDPSRVVTTTTTTTFSMSRDMAKGICQHFMDARLIENAADLSSAVMKDKGVYVLTPKGLHILERFITKNGINGEHLLKVFSSQPICMKLLHLERKVQDDELVVNRGVLEVIFRRFAGRQPNYPPADSGVEQEFDQTLGIEVVDISEKAKGAKGGMRTVQHTFSALSAIDWLLDFTTMCGRDEAAEVAAHFVRLKLIELVQYKKPGSEAESIVTVEGTSGVGARTTGELRCHSKAIYAMTDWGRTVARWPGYNANEAGQTSSFSTQGASSMRRNSSAYGNGVDESQNASSSQGVSLHPGASAESQYSSARPSAGDESTVRTSSSVSEHGRSDMFVSDASAYTYNRDSNSKRLRQILEEPALRSLFRDFLKQNFCEENLSFWLDVQDFKRRFNTTSSAVAVRGNDSGSGRDSGVVGAFRKLGASKGSNPRDGESSGQNAMEKHQRDLVAMAFAIYNTYLSPSSSCELNVPHSLRSDLVSYMSKIIAEAKEAEGVTAASAPELQRGSSESSLGRDEQRGAAGTVTMPRAALHASQLQAMVRLYERIQDRKCQPLERASPTSMKLTMIPPLQISSDSWRRTRYHDSSRSPASSIWSAASRSTLRRLRLGASTPRRMQGLVSASLLLMRWSLARPFTGWRKAPQQRWPRYSVRARRHIIPRHIASIRMHPSRLRLPRVRSSGVVGVTRSQTATRKGGELRCEHVQDARSASRLAGGTNAAKHASAPLLFKSFSSTVRDDYNTTLYNPQQPFPIMYRHQR